MIELNFFMVTVMELCFGSVLEIVLITQGCFHYCWAVFTQTCLFCLPLHPTCAGTGVHEFRWDTSGLLISTDQRNIPDCITSCSACNTGWSTSDGFCLLKHCYHDGASLFLKWLNTCLPTGSGQWVPFMCGFCLAIKLPLSPQVFSLLCFQFSPPSHWWGMIEQLGGV